MTALRHSAAAVVAFTAAPVLLGALALRPAWRVGWRERIGRGPRPTTGALWVHGSSVGEILAAARVIDALRASGHAVLASTSTATGREVMRRARPDVPVRFAPLDHPWCVDAALDRIRPRALVLIETELWPCLIAAAADRGLPVVLVSGRLSDRSFPRYQRFAPWMGRTLRRMRAIGARTERDRERFLALGALPERVCVSGDLKLEFDAQPLALAPDLASFVGERPLLVAGSTHPGEEAAALEAFEIAVRAAPGAALVLAPRHPARTDEALVAARQVGRVVHRRSKLGAARLGAGEVLVVDTLGELPALYARALLAFVGGTLAPLGGHNVLEPVAARRPVAFGPHTANVAHATTLLEACGAGVRVRDPASLGRAFAAALADPAAARARGEAGWLALQEHQGSAARAARLVLDALEG